MAQYTQAGRPMAVTTPLGTDALLLVSLRGHEAISQLFQFELELLAEHGTPIAFERLMGQSVTVELTPWAGGRYFNGIINRFSQGRRDAEFTHFRATMVPRLWLWTKKVQSRIFQHLTVPEILKKVLEGLDVVYQIQGTFHPRDYCVQYRESDFAFVSRLMEEEGIYYYFKHAAGQHELVLTDVSGQHPEVPGLATVVYDEVQGGVRDKARVTAWEKTQELRSGKYTLWDHCFELPGRNLEAQRTILDSVVAGQVSHRLQVGGNERLEIYDYPGAYAQRFDGVDKGGGDRPADLQKIFEDNKRTVKIRMEQETTPSVQVRGESTCIPFLAGHQFTLAQHFDADGPYLLTRVEHTANQSHYRSGGEVVFDYQNSFTAIPARLPYRPPRLTPRPNILGTQTATVVGPKGEEVFCDKYGRVKVQFPWDRQGKNDADSSCWIRVAQVWAGKGWGAFFWPRVGQEVVVAFEEGDPDRPIIVGSVYNEANMPPFKLPEERLVSGIKSCSDHGKPQREFNGLIFYDQPGNEHVQIHSQTHQILTNEESQYTHVGGTCVQVVGGLHALGSGSGGGKDEEQDAKIAKLEEKEKERDEEKKHPFAWESSSVLGSMAKKLDITFGQKSEAVVGFNWEDSLGARREFVIDPLTFFGLPLPAAPMALIAGMLGKTEVTCGVDTEVLYGPKVEVQHGRKIEYESPLGWHTLKEGATVMGLLSVASGILFGATAGLWKDLKDADNAWFVSNLVRQVLIGLQITLEAAQGIAENTKDKVKEVEAQTERILKFLKPPDRDLAKWMKYLMEAPQARILEIAKLVEGASKVLIKPEVDKDEKSIAESKKIEGNFTLSAYDISLVSAAPDNPLATRRSMPTSLTIDARGSGDDGLLWLHGTGTAMLSCDTACVAIRKTGKQEVLIECDATGVINIHHGLTATSPRIKLTEKGITLSVGLDANPMSTIEMTLEGIELKVGPQSSIKLTPTGIETKGLELKSKAQITWGVETAMHSHEVKAPYKHQGSINMIT